MSFWEFLGAVAVALIALVLLAAARSNRPW